MIILRTKTDTGITTFTFNQIVLPGTTQHDADLADFDAARRAAKVVKRTSAAGFIAWVDSANDTHGRIIEKWDHIGKMGFRSLTYDIQYGRYKDEIYAVIGTEEFCNTKAENINARCECWADDTAHVEHVAGPVYICVVKRPYTD